MEPEQVGVVGLINIQLFPLIVYPLLHDVTVHVPYDDQVPRLQVLD